MSTKLYLITREGKDGAVENLTIWLHKNKARRHAMALAKNCVDDYHTYEVLEFQANQPQLMLENTVIATYQKGREPIEKFPENVPKNEIEKEVEKEEKRVSKEKLKD